MSINPLNPVEVLTSEAGLPCGESTFLEDYRSLEIFMSLESQFNMHIFFV